MAHQIQIGEFTWSPSFPAEKEAFFKADPGPWVFNREEVKVQYADYAFMRDYGGARRIIRVAGLATSDDYGTMEAEINNISKLWKQDVTEGEGEEAVTTTHRNCIITAGSYTYNNCYLMDHGNPTIEPSADPLYHIRYNLTFMQFPDGTLGDI